MCFCPPIGGIQQCFFPSCMLRLVFILIIVKMCAFCLCLGAQWKSVNDSVSEQQAWIQSLPSFIFSYFHTNTLSSCIQTAWEASLSFRGINPDPKNSHYHQDRSQRRVKKRREDGSDLLLHSSICTTLPPSHTRLPRYKMFLITYRLYIVGTCAAHKTQQMELSVWRSLIVDRYRGVSRASTGWSELVA